MIKPILDIPQTVTQWLTLLVTVGTIIVFLIGLIRSLIRYMKQVIVIKREMKKEYLKGNKYLYHFTQNDGKVVLRKLKLKFKMKYLNNKTNVLITDISDDDNTHLKYKGFVKNEGGQPLFLLESQKTNAGKSEKEETQIRFASFDDFDKKQAYGVWMGKDLDDNPACGVRLYSQTKLPDKVVYQLINGFRRKDKSHPEMCLAMLNIEKKSAPIPDSRVRVLEGNWHVYHFTKMKGEIIFRHDHWTIKKDWQNKQIIETKDHEIPDLEYEGSISFERNYFLVLLKGIKHEEETRIRFFDIIPNGEEETYGLWMGIDFDNKPISGLRLMSKKELDNEDAKKMIISRTLIYERLLLSINEITDIEENK